MQTEHMVLVSKYKDTTLNKRYHLMWERQSTKYELTDFSVQFWFREWTRFDHEVIH